MGLKIEQAENGDSFLEIPQATLDELGWNEYTVLSVNCEHHSIILRQKTEWTVEELQCDDNFDKVMEDVVNNKTVHSIIHEDKKFVLAPISDEHNKLLEEFKENSE